MGLSFLQFLQLKNIPSDSYWQVRIIRIIEINRAAEDGFTRLIFVSRKDDGQWCWNYHNQLYNSWWGHSWNQQGISARTHTHTSTHTQHTHTHAHTHTHTHTSTHTLTRALSHIGYTQPTLPTFTNFWNSGSRCGRGMCCAFRSVNIYQNKCTVTLRRVLRLLCWGDCVSQFQVLLPKELWQSSRPMGIAYIK